MTVKVVENSADEYILDEITYTSDDESETVRMVPIFDTGMTNTHLQVEVTKDGNTTTVAIPYSDVTEFLSATCFGMGVAPD